jgi:hypothetical protein
MIFLYALINDGLMWKPFYFRTVPERNLCSDVRTKTSYGNVSKNLLLLYAKQFKTKQNMFLLVGVWSSLDTVRHFDHVSAVKAYRTRMTMI